MLLDLLVDQINQLVPDIVEYALVGREGNGLLFQVL